MKRILMITMLTLAALAIASPISAIRVRSASSQPAAIPPPICPPFCK